MSSYQLSGMRSREAYLGTAGGSTLGGDSRSSRLGLEVEGAGDSTAADVHGLSITTASDVIILILRRVLHVVGSLVVPVAVEGNVERASNGAATRAVSTWKVVRAQI